MFVLVGVGYFGLYLLFGSIVVVFLAMNRLVVPLVVVGYVMSSLSLTFPSSILITQINPHITKWNPQQTLIKSYAQTLAS